MSRLQLEKSTLCQTFLDDDDPISERNQNVSVIFREFSERTEQQEREIERLARQVREMEVPDLNSSHGGKVADLNLSHGGGKGDNGTNGENRELQKGSDQDEKDEEMDKVNGGKMDGKSGNGKGNDWKEEDSRQQNGYEEVSTIRPPSSVSEKKNHEDEEVEDSFFQEKETSPQMLFNSEKWQKVNQLLRSNGYPGIEDEDDWIDRISDTFISLLQNNIDQKNQIRHLKEENVRNPQDEQLILRYKEKTKALQEKLEKAQAELKSIQAKPVEQPAANTGVIKQLKSELSHLQVKVSHAEAESKEKDKVISDYQKKLNQLVESQEKSIDEAKKIYQRYYKQSPTTKANHRELSIIQLYEDKMKQLKEELKFYKREANHVNPSKPGSSNESDHELRRKLMEIESAMKNQEKNSNLKLQHAQRTIDSVQEENSRLMKEINSLPKLLEWEETKMKYEELKRKFNARGRGKCPEAIIVTKESVRKEKFNQVNRHKAKAIMLEVAEFLKVEEIEDIVPVLKKQATVLKAIPNLKKFIQELINFLHSSRRLLNLEETRIAPQDCIPLLQEYVTKLMRMESYIELEKEILNRLFARQKNRFTFSRYQYNHDLYRQQVINCIGEMVTQENNNIAVQQGFKLAEDFANLHPDDTHVHIINHLKDLFGFQLSELLPRFNEIYLSFSEIGAGLNDIQTMISKNESGDEIVKLCDELISKLRRIRRRT